MESYGSLSSLCSRKTFHGGVGGEVPEWRGQPRQHDGGGYGAGAPRTRSAWCSACDLPRAGPPQGHLQKRKNNRKIESEGGSYGGREEGAGDCHTHKKILTQHAELHTSGLIRDTPCLRAPSPTIRSAAASSSNSPIVPHSLTMPPYPYKSSSSQEASWRW